MAVVQRCQSAQRSESIHITHLLMAASFLPTETSFRRLLLILRRSPLAQDHRRSLLTPSRLLYFISVSLRPRHRQSVYGGYRHQTHLTGSQTVLLGDGWCIYLLTPTPPPSGFQPDGGQTGQTGYVRGFYPTWSTCSLWWRQL